MKSWFCITNLKEENHELTVNNDCEICNINAKEFRCAKIEASN